MMDPRVLVVTTIAALTLTGSAMTADEPEGLQVAEPVEGLTDVFEVAWDHIDVRGEGRVLDIYFMGGHPSCFGLERIEVGPVEVGIDVRLHVGRPATATICPKIALRRVTTVELDEPIVLGGTAPVVVPDET